MNQQERDDFVVGCRFVSDGEYTGVMCRHVGVARLTRVAVKRHGKTSFEARVGIAVFGSTQSPDGCDEGANPFDPDFPENYCVGKGLTEVDALKALDQDMRDTADALFF